MSDAFQAWPARKPSPGFAERVAIEARREHMARRAKKVRGAVYAAMTLSLAAGALFMAKGHIDHLAETAAIEAEGPNPSTPWPTSDGWLDLTFPFPIDFVPELPYRGAVRIHLAPEFGTPGAPGYFSFVNAWVTESDGRKGEPDPRELETNLRAYYTGLCGIHGHPSVHAISPGWRSQFANLKPAPLSTADRELGRTAAFRGDVDVVDCMTTGEELTLQIDAVAGTCFNGATYVAYAMSTRPFEDPVWESLRAERRMFDCRKSPRSNNPPAEPGGL